MTGGFSFSDGNRKKKLHSFVTIEIFSREKFSQSKSSESVNSAVQTTLTIYKRNPRYIIVFTIRWLSIQCAGNSSQVHCYFLLIECEELMVGSSLLSCINGLLSACSYLIITRLEFRDWTTPTNYYRRIFLLSLLENESIQFQKARSVIFPHHLLYLEPSRQKLIKFMCEI